MALELYNTLEKERHSSSSSRSSLHDPSRFSIDSQEKDIDEQDPLHPNGSAYENGNASIAYAHANGGRDGSPLPYFRRGNRSKDGRSRWRTAFERCIPVSKLERWTIFQNVGRNLPGYTIRILRRPVFRIKRCLPVVPGHLCALIATIVAFLILVITGSAGVYVAKKGTMDGQSPPWYPTPLGGQLSTWSKSYGKAASLVHKMSLVEKINITTGTGWQMGMCVGNTGPAQLAGFPSLCLQDGPLGIRFTEKITAGPAGITVGATWNKNLMRKRGSMLGIEARLKGINVLLGPSVGPLGRMPAGGRNWEGFGSDPVLQGCAAAETIRGIQEEGVMATIKHFVGNEQEHFRQANEWGFPHAISTNIDDRTLHELYAWPFADSIRAGVASVMCSYNQVNNSYACQNSKLINGILKDELGFQGFVQSDWLAQRSGVASALAGLDMSMPGDGATWANGKSFWGPELTTAVLNGSVPVQRLNDMVTRIVAAWYQLGQDDKSRWPRPPPEGEGGPNFSSWTDDEMGLLHPGSDDKTVGEVNQYISTVNGGVFSHRSRARKIAAEGIVLLKNQADILPLNRAGGSQRDPQGTSKIGPRRYLVSAYGEDLREPEGGPNMCDDRACNKGTLASGWGSGAVEFPYLVTPLDGLRGAFSDEKVWFRSFPENTLPSKLNDTQIEFQDLCMVFVNADAGEGFQRWSNVLGDRPDLKIQKGGEQLIKEVAAKCGTKNTSNKQGKGAKATYKNSPTIVVIHSVGPVLLESFIEDENVRAVLMAHLPGQESGNALVDVLFGSENPSGRLPYTIGKSLADYGPGGQVLYFSNLKGILPQQNFSEGLMIDYRWFDSQNIEPRYEFGYGLSYSRFSLKDIRIQLAKQERPSRLPAPRPAPTSQPPRYDTSIPDASKALFPSNIRRLKRYIYPYISNPKQIKLDVQHLATQALEPHATSNAGGGEGGNPDLWESLVEVTVSVTNESDMDGQVVVQLYVKFPDDVYEDITETEVKSKKRSGEHSYGNGHREKIEFPPRVLRAFNKIHTYKNTGGSFFHFMGDDSSSGAQKVKFSLTRRDLSYWSVREQNWVLPDGKFEIQVGFSSRDIQLKQEIF